MCRGSLAREQTSAEKQNHTCIYALCTVQLYSLPPKNSNKNNKKHATTTTTTKNHTKHYKQIPDNKHTHTHTKMHAHTHTHTHTQQKTQQQQSNNGKNIPLTLAKSRLNSVTGYYWLQPNNKMTTLTLAWLI